jgi:hypothetical protein
MLGTEYKFGREGHVSGNRRLSVAATFRQHTISSITAILAEVIRTPLKNCRRKVSGYSSAFEAENGRVVEWMEVTNFAAEQ